jgi:xanthine dehydrogenase accessory factor
MDAAERVSDECAPLRLIVERIDREDRFALAVVMKSEGSTPRAAGTMALIDETGAIAGTIGGGQLEAEAQRRGIEAIRSRIPVTFQFTYHGVSAAERDPICGGQMRVLVLPVNQEHHDAFRAAEQARLRRERGLLTIRFEPAAKAVVVVGFTIDRGASRRSGVSEERRHLPEEKLDSGGLPTRRFEGARSEAAEESLVVPLIPPPRLLIFGGGHVGQALARQASLMGFDITVIDDRPEFAAPDRFPCGVATRCAPMDDEATQITMDEDTFVAIVTRGHPQDSAVLARCLHRPTAYLGMMGSRRKVALLRREFIASGQATAEEFDRVHAPIGLELGAETVPEIAASIVAQLVAVRRKRLAARISSAPNS